MIKKLRDILNTYTDEELEELDIWIDSRTKVDSIWVEEYHITLITDEASVDVNNYIDKEPKNENCQKEEKERIKKILLGNGGLRHYLLKTADGTELDVVDYKEYKKLDSKIDEIIEILKHKYSDTMLGKYGSKLKYTLLDVLKEVK